MTKVITLKRQIRSVKSTRQITKAMQLVAANKLKRAQAQAAASREYRAVAYDLLVRLSTSYEVMRRPLFARRQVKTRLYVVLTSNTGLAGAYNANVLKQLVADVRTDQANSITSQAVVIGSKGAQLVRHLEGIEMTAYYPFFGDHPTEADVRPLLHAVTEQFVERAVDEVRLLYTLAPSSVKQTVVDLVLLPARLPDNDEAEATVLNFEPSADVVVDHVARRLIGVQLWQAALEAQASEQLMRMLAMKNATDNANDLINDYTLEYQTVRQAAITQEIAEITGGVEAMRN